MKNLIPHERFSPSITEKQRLEEEVDKAFDYIRNEISNICLNTKSSLSKTFATYASVSSNREEISTGTSYAELWARISTAITIIQEDYVDFYADLMKNIRICISLLMKMCKKHLLMLFTSVLRLIPLISMHIR